MAGRAFLGSVASRLRGGGARSGPAAGGFLTPPPTSQRRGYGFVVGNGMAAGVALGSLATKLALPTLAPPRRLLHVASGSTLPTSKLVFPAALCAKTRAGVAYVALFGSLIYMYGWVMPKMESLESNLKAWKNSNDKLTQAIEAVQLRLADEHVSTDVSHVQSSGLGKKPDDVTGNSTTVDKVKSVEMEAQCHSKDLEAPTDPHAEFNAKFNADLDKVMARIAKLRSSLESS